MGNVTRFFKKVDGSEFESARAIHIRRTSSIPPGIYSSTFCIQTLNGKLLITFDYQSRYFSRDLAHNFLDNVVKIIENQGRNSYVK